MANGRVWTGRQALNVGLVDHMGGLNKALKVAAELAGLPMIPGLKAGWRVETSREPRGGIGIPFLSASSGLEVSKGVDVLALCDDSVAYSKLVSEETLGISPLFASLNQLLTYNIAQSSYREYVIKLFSNNVSINKIGIFLKELFE